MNYSSDRKFRIWDYTVSHSTLFLRSYLFEEDEQATTIINDTIDIEFYAVGYIELPDSMNGISLSLIKENIPERLKDFLKHDLKLFELNTNTRKGYVIAGGCVVGKSSWEHDKGRFENLGLNYPEVLLTI